jgi:hypothetical protein
MPKLDALVRAAALADAHARFVFDWPTAPAAFDARDADGDTVLVMREDVDAGTPDLRFARLNFDPVRIARQLLELTVDRRDYVDRDRAAGYTDALEQLARARHAVIVYTHQFREPRVEGGTDYHGGIVGGVALLCDLDPIAFRGGVEYGAGSSWELRSKDALIGDALRDDLCRHFFDALMTKLAQRFPGAKLPVTLGY